MFSTLFRSIWTLISLLMWAVVILRTFQGLWIMVCAMTSEMKILIKKITKRRAAKK